ncbi:MAG: hypothetical protein AAFO04_07230 [Cyanobacteria bacterium J06592_8]
MSNNVNIGGNGSYKGFQSVQEHYDDSLKYNRWLKGVRPKVQDKKYLLLQFKHPGSGKCNPKRCNCSFTIAGIETAINKAWKVKEAFSSFAVASDFWEWYEREIEETTQIENDLKTYRQIFQKIENEYFAGINPNTKRKRSREIDNDIKSFDGYYGNIFKKLPN